MACSSRSTLAAMCPTSCSQSNRVASCASSSTGAVTEARFFSGTEFLYQVTNALVSIRDHPSRSRLSVLLRNGDRSRLCVDIQTNKPYSLHRPAAFACGSAFPHTDSQRKPGNAYRGRSFPGENQDSARGQSRFVPSRFVSLRLASLTCLLAQPKMSSKCRTPRL